MQAPIVLLVVLSIFASLASGRAQGDSHVAKPLRIGVVGLAHDHIHGFFRQFLNRTDMEIVGIAEPDQDLTRRIVAKYPLADVPKFQSLDEMLDKVHPQAVVTYTSTYDHRKVVEVCARHGVHVMMEKPLAVSLEDALAIQKAAAEGHIQVLVNYETTWYASNHAAYDLLKAGAIGDLRKFVAHDGHRGPKEIGCSADFLKWLTDPKLNGAGALFDFGCYGADLVTWMMDGQRPQSVTAVTQQIKPEVYPKVDDEATIILTYPHAQAIIQASWNWPFDRKDIEVYGKTGYVKTIQRGFIRVEDREVPAETKALAYPFGNQISYLRAVVLEGLKPTGLSALDTNVTVVEILDAARRSAKEGRTIRLGEENRK